MDTPFTTTLTNGPDTLVFVGHDLFDIPWTIDALGGDDSVTINAGTITSGGGDFTICNLGDGNDFARVNGGYLVRVFGQEGNDSLDLYSRAFFDGGLGNDTLNVFDGASVSMTGGPGADTVNFYSSTFCSIAGGADDDVFIGNGRLLAGSIDGGDGNDSFTGLANAGAGMLTLVGGAGNDIFAGTTAEMDGVIIADFSPGDLIRFTNVPASFFHFTLSGNTLTYTGGSLTFGKPLAGSLQLLDLGGRTFLKVVAGEPAHHPDNDFNGDGRSDILFINDARTSVHLFYATSSGGFEDGLTFNAGSIVGAGDFNGDGREDLLENGLVLLQTIGASFQPDFEGATTFVTDGWQIAGTGDFNGDGRTDILLRNQDGSVTYRPIGPADSTVVDVPDAPILTNPNFNLNPGNNWAIQGTGDFNSDGRDDILWRSDSGTVVILLGQENGSFIGKVDLNLNPGADWNIAGVADFNGDGFDDILWRNDNGAVADTLGQPNGYFAANPAFALNPGLDWHVAGTGDYNGDGFDDILWRSDNGALVNLLGQDDGTFVGNVGIDFNPGLDWSVQPERLGLWDY